MNTVLQTRAAMTRTLLPLLRGVAQANLASSTFVDEDSTPQPLDLDYLLEAFGSIANVAREPLSRLTTATPVSMHVAATVETFFLEDIPARSIQPSASK